MQLYSMCKEATKMANRIKNLGLLRKDKNRGHSLSEMAKKERSPYHDLKSDKNVLLKDTT